MSTPAEGQNVLVRPTDLDRFLASHAKALAELTAQDDHHAWVAVEAVPFTGLLGGKGVSSWMLFTYPDGTINFEDDYDNSLTQELFSGQFCDECPGRGEGHAHRVRWASEQERDELWSTVGIDSFVTMGHYYSMMSEQRGEISIVDDLPERLRAVRDKAKRLLRR